MVLPKGPRLRSGLVSCRWALVRVHELSLPGGEGPQEG